jgi:hypothetical protein
MMVKVSSLRDKSHGIASKTAYAISGILQVPAQQRYNSGEINARYRTVLQSGTPTVKHHFSRESPQ